MQTWPLSSFSLRAQYTLNRPDLTQLTDYLVDALDNPTPSQAADLAKISCDIITSKVCATGAER
jgi:alpha,alpha-trehalase